MRRSAAHVFVSAIDEPVLDAADEHHLARVLRLAPGDIVSVSDGRGAWRLCRWVTSGLEADGPVHRLEASDPPLTVGFAPVKGDRPEWAVQKLTELGVDRIVVLRAERSVVRWEGDRLTAQLERLRRVAREASMQSRRCDIPHIDGVINVGDAVGALAHFDGAPLTAAHTAVLIGPEGGWSDDEVCGRDAVSLGPTVLRAETAAVAAAVRMTALRDS